MTMTPWISQPVHRRIQAVVVDEKARAQKKTEEWGSWNKFKTRTQFDRSLRQVFVLQVSPILKPKILDANNKNNKNKIADFFVFE